MHEGSTEIPTRTTITPTIAETILNAAEIKEETVKLDGNKNGNHKKYLLPVPLFFCLQRKPPNKDWELSHPANVKAPFSGYLQEDRQD